MNFHKGLLQALVETEFDGNKYSTDSMLVNEVALLTTRQQWKQSYLFVMCLWSK